VDVTFRRVRVFDGARFSGGAQDVVVHNGHIVAMNPAADGSGGVLFPGFVDAHVHIAFSSSAAIVRGGVTTALDLGAPLGVAFESDHAPLRLGVSGPLLTAPGGYPTRSWGANGFGLEIANAESARAAVAMLSERGAAMIKVALEPAEPPVLPDDVLHAIVLEAHARGLRVAAHALRAEAVSMVLRAGVDVLAHTPVDRLSDDVVAALGAARTWVISTVRAFGASRRARANLEAMAEAGCRIVYGTDLGNGAIQPGIDVAELSILAEVLGSEERALAAATSTAAELCDVTERADLVWLPSYERLTDLAGPKRVFVDGVEITP
jgi:imidazolonepropionase-like amidohydrolase